MGSGFTLLVRMWHSLELAFLLESEILTVHFVLLSLINTNDPPSNMVDLMASQLETIFLRLLCSTALPCD